MILSGLFVFLVGSVVLLGWILDVPVLTSLHPEWVTMKAATAVCFCLSGAMMVFAAAKSVFWNLQAVLCSAGVVWCMTLMAVDALFGLDIGMTGLFIEEAPGAVLSVRPGEPSLATVLCFVVFALGGIFYLTGEHVLQRAFCSAPLLLGAMALVGYFLSEDRALFYLPGVSTGMALTTAALFTLMGAVGMVSRRESVLNHRF